MKINTNRVDTMEAMSEDESVAFRNFMKEFKFNRYKFIFLLEGVDDLDYYFPIFESRIGKYKEDWIELVCHGRENVVELVKDLKNHSRDEYKQSLHYGFIDKDYNEVSDNAFPEKVYITPVYSIENFYTSMSFFKRILARKFFLAENDEENKDFQKCCENFSERLSDFVTAITELDMLLRCNRIMYKKNSDNIKINARDINLDKMFDLKLESIIIKENAYSIINRSEDEFDNDSMNLSKSYYKGRDYIETSKFIRGKFMFYFMFNHLLNLKNAHRAKEPKFFEDSYEMSKIKGAGRKSFKKTKLSINRESHDVMSELCQFADVPGCLIGFLRSIDKKRINSPKLVIE